MQTLTLEQTRTRDFAWVLLATFAICLSGHISIPLWFTPVPLALQNSCVLLLAALLGPRLGFAAVFAFLIQGAMGLPVFSAGPTVGLARLVGPTGGYLLGYLVAAFVVGAIAERHKSLRGAVCALTVGNAIIYLLGASYLAKFVGLNKAFALGVAPFLVGDFFKTLISLKILQWAGWRRG